MADAQGLNYAFSTLHERSSLSVPHLVHVLRALTLQADALSHDMHPGSPQLIGVQADDAAVMLFTGWNGHDHGMPNISSVQDYDRGPVVAAASGAGGKSTR